MYLDPVSYCNLQCPFCPTGEKSSDRETAKASLDNFKHVMDHIGPYLFELKLYNWGEPLLNENVPAMISYAKKFHMVVTISSNLSIPITEERAEALVSSGLDFLICSIDGASQETYKKYRIGGDFLLIMKNIKLINKIKKEKNSKTPFLIWQFLVFKHNQHEIELAKKTANELNISITFEKPGIPTNHIEGWSSTIPEYSSLLSYIKPPSIQSKSNVNYQNSKNNKNKKPCTWLWSAIVLNPSNNVSPCCAIINQKDDFGKINVNIQDVWNNENYKNARQLFKKNPKPTNLICQNCPFPDLQQNIRNHDEQILFSLFSKFAKRKKSLGYNLAKKLLLFFLNKIDHEWGKKLSKESY